MKQVISIFLSVILFSSILIANSNKENEEYAAFAEVMPKPVGGMSSVIKNIEYPVLASTNKIEGKVYVLAFIDEAGKVNDVKVVKDIGYGCGEAAVEAVKTSRFEPGKSKGQPIKVKLTLMIDFKLS
ncbi:MAG: energy transducer TonB [Melioribacteraceae bacterium]|nr:energy transducer TonB [Melioribacteraceae bacterium]